MNKRYRRPVWAAVPVFAVCGFLRQRDIFEKDKTAGRGSRRTRNFPALLNPEGLPAAVRPDFRSFSPPRTSIGQRVETGRSEKSAVVDRQRARRARSVRFSPPINSGRQVVHTFFEYDLDDDRTSDVDLPAVQIDLLEYDRIQRMVFQQYNCISCHQGNQRGRRLAADRRRQLPLAGRRARDALGQAARRTRSRSFCWTC